MSLLLQYSMSEKPFPCIWISSNAIKQQVMITTLQTHVLTSPFEMSQEDPDVHALFGVKYCDLARRGTETIINYSTQVIKGLASVQMTGQAIGEAKPSHILMVPHY